ncbi:hypothetical protein ZEAMMB73_Zm00001d010436 [Zea mays]|uniref:Helitron helicase-like domain-containing protein n=1 Tax=Zea mays TaxID=4577 RepID=A0A1Q1BYE7_MAIZE|nr:hypothetical protein ZEAMMB73_Zm00001d010436 [Zea mays]
MFETDDGAGGQPDPEMASSLLDMLNENNSLVKAFRYARERLEREGDQKITLRLLGCNTRHDVQYNLPSNGEIAAIIVGNYTAGEYTYDVLVHDRECGLKHVSCLHPAYMALRYPLLFPYGEHGFHLGIRYFGADDVGSSKRKYVTMLEFVRRHLHYRLDEPNPYTCYGRLSDQIDVDVYSTIEGNMLQFIASHQSDLRSETVQGIADAIDKGSVHADSIGGRVVVPASFTCGRRYHVTNYQDAMAICRVYGPPDLFVTFTCNTKWREIADALRFEPGQQPCDHGLCLSKGSPCKWYINPDVPEAGALMASARKAHSPIKWNEVLSSNQPMPRVPEEQKIAYIRDLHPFENKDREFLVTVTVKKIGDRWWYKLLLTAGDETGDTDFILFGWMAQRIIKKSCDMLIANNPIGFIPDPIIDLLEKTYIWNVNVVVAEIDTAKDSIQASSSGPKQSQTVLLQGAPSGIEDTPTKASNLVMPSTLLTPQSSATSVQDKTIGIGSDHVVPGATPAITKEPTTTPRKRKMQIENILLHHRHIPQDHASHGIEVSVSFRHTKVHIHFT